VPQNSLTKIFIRKITNLITVAKFELEAQNVKIFRGCGLTSQGKNPEKNVFRKKKQPF